MSSGYRHHVGAIVFAVGSLLPVAPYAHAQTTLSAFYAGEVHGGVERGEIGASIPTPLRGRIGSAALNVSMNLDLAQWHTTSSAGRSRLTDIGLTPQLRFLLPDEERMQPYIDLGVGAHYLSAYEIDGHHLGGRYQFGDYAGLGARFGEQHHMAVSVRLLHESNCGTHTKNSGLTALGLRFEYTLP